MQEQPLMPEWVNKTNNNQKEINELMEHTDRLRDWLSKHDADRPVDMVEARERLVEHLLSGIPD